MAGCTALFGLAIGSLVPIGPDYDPSKEVKPNAAQLEILKRIAQQYDFVCLGDTDHSIAEIQQFARHPELVAAMASCGKNHYFMEIPVSKDHLLSPGIDNREFIERCEEDLVGSWIVSDEARENVCDSFSASINGKKMVFMAVDQRHKKGNSPFGKLSLTQKITGMPLYAAYWVQNKLFGCIGYSFTTISLTIPFAIATGGDLSFLADDRATADNISEITDNGVILYGSGHYYNIEAGNPEHLMTRQLQEKGRSCCIVNIYKDEDHKLEDPRASASDVDIVVFPSKENPGGVYINNPDLKTVSRPMAVSRRGFLRPSKPG